MTVQADSCEVSEQGCKLGSIGVRQLRLEQGRHVAAQVRRVAGPEQHDIDAGFVARVTVGGIDQIGSAAVVNQKAQRIVSGAQRWVDQSFGSELFHLARDTRGVAPRSAMATGLALGTCAG